MYNNLRKCLIASINFHRKLLSQSIHEGILSHEINYHANNTRWNDATHTRFYCQMVNVKKTSEMMKQGLQEKLDEMLSDPETMKRFQILQLEVDVMRHNAERVPEKIGAKDWLMILKTTTKTQRRRYLDFLWRNEKNSENEKQKKELRKAEYVAKKAEAEQVGDTGEIKYGLLYNSLFLRIYDTTMNFYQNARLIRGMMFEPKIVFDCGYDDYMTQRETHNCAKQMTLAFANNRCHANPMCLYFCNLKKDGLLMEFFQLNIPNLLDDDFPAVITSQSYLDLFPKDQLVYLTPHCRTDMTEYDPDKIYIIGAMVDKSNPQHLSLAKAKREGIRMARLPVDQYLEWGCGSTKSFTLNQILNIMLDLRHTKDWNVALKNVPSRKLKEAREYQLQRKMLKFSNFEKRNSKIETDFTFNSRKSR